MPQNKRMRQGTKNSHNDPSYSSREEDTESDSSFASSSTRPPSQSTNTRTNSHSGPRKRSLGGNQPRTPHPKKRPDEITKQHSQMAKTQPQCPPSGPNTGTTEGTHSITHLGHLATQALTILQNPTGFNANPVPNIGPSGPNTMTRGTTNTVLHQPNTTIPAMFPTKQSTLDAHVTSVASPSSNFPSPLNPPPPT